MKVYDKVFVACNARRDSKRVDGEEQALLSYVVPVEKNGKRIESAIKWAKGYYSWDENAEPITYTLDNVPVKGYRIIGFSNRYSTSNKHIYVMHPTYKFYFELTIEAFVELTKETTIKDGIIEDGLIFYFHNGKNGLAKHDSEFAKRMIYVDRVVDTINISDVAPLSEVIIDKRNQVGTRLFYLGYGDLAIDGILYHNKKVVEWISKNADGSTKYNSYSQIGNSVSSIYEVLYSNNDKDHRGNPIKTSKFDIGIEQLTDFVLEEKRHYFVAIDMNTGSISFEYIKAKKPKVVSVMENDVFKDLDDLLQMMIDRENTNSPYGRFSINTLMDGYYTDCRLIEKHFNLHPNSIAHGLGRWNVYHVDITKIKIK